MLSIGCVGTSGIMQVIQEGIRQTPGLQCRVVYSRDAARGAAFALAQQIPESCDDFTAMIHRTDLDVIYLASPNCCHVDQALAAIGAGKHVIVEKPLAVTRDQALAVCQAAQTAGVMIFEAITTLFMPNYLRCRSLLPELGQIKQAELCYGQYSSKYDAYVRGENPNIFNPAMQAGALNDMGVYCIHMAVDLFGPPQQVHYTAQYGPNGIDLAGTLELDYGSFRCTVRTSKNADIGSGIRIVGSRGQLRQDGPINSFDSAQAVVGSDMEQICLHRGENRMVHEFARFRDAICDKDRDFFAGMCRQSIAVSTILQQAHQAQTAGAQG